MTAQESALSDEALALSAQQGSQTAFEALVGRHKHALYRLVRRYIGDADDAYDILQDAWISVWDTLHRYDVGRPFVAWIYVITLNKCRDFSRRQRFRRLVLSTFATEAAPTAAAEQEGDLEMKARQDMRLRRLDEAIAALPALYKEPLVLTTAGGLSQEAAAAVLRTTTKAVEMRLRRARRKLIEALNPSEEGQT